MTWNEALKEVRELKAENEKLREDVVALKCEKYGYEDFKATLKSERETHVEIFNDLLSKHYEDVEELERKIVTLEGDLDGELMASEVVLKAFKEHVKKLEKNLAASRLGCLPIKGKYGVGL